MLCDAWCRRTATGQLVLVSLIIVKGHTSIKLDMDIKEVLNIKSLQIEGGSVFSSKCSDSLTITSGPVDTYLCGEEIFQ